MLFFRRALAGNIIRLHGREQVGQRNAHRMQEGIGDFRTHRPDSLQDMMHVRLGHVQAPCQPALGDLAIADPPVDLLPKMIENINKEYQAGASRDFYLKYTSPKSFT
jgi:hypothetical protein